MEGKIRRDYGKAEAKREGTGRIRKLSAEALSRMRRPNVTAAAAASPSFTRECAQALAMGRELKAPSRTVCLTKQGLFRRS